MKHIKLFEEFITEGRGKATTLLQDVANGNTSSAEGIKMSKGMAAHILNWVNTSPYGKKYRDLPLHQLVRTGFNWGIERGLDPQLKGELKDLQAQVAESLTESHFQVGDKVKCIKSGMTGEVVSLDDPAETPDAKYYNVKREDGKMMKYAPDELELAESLKEGFFGPFMFSNSTDTDKLKEIYNDALNGYANWQRGFEYPKSDYKKAYQEAEKILKKRGVNV